MKKQLDQKTTAALIVATVAVLGGVGFLMMRNSDGGSPTSENMGMPPSAAADFNKRMQQAGAGAIGPGKVIPAPVAP